MMSRNVKSSKAAGSTGGSSKALRRPTSEEVGKSAPHSSPLPPLTASPVVASLDASSTLCSPYSAISLSPCRHYAVLACRDLLQIVQVRPSGLQLVLAVRTAPYFSPPDTKRTVSQAQAPLLNLREFALGGRNSGSGSTTAPVVAPSSTNLNVVLTDVAWSRGDRPSPRKQKRRSNSDDDNSRDYAYSEDDYDDYDTVDDTDMDSAWTDKDQYHDLTRELSTSFIAAAGSNGVIVVWSVAALLSVTNRTTGPALSSKSLVVPPDAELCQHTRQVNRLAWHPHKYGVLLSASQDGTVLLWERTALYPPQPPHAVTATEPNVSIRTDEARSGGGPRFRGLFGFTTAASLQQAPAPLGSNSTTNRPFVQTQFQWQCRATYTPKSEAVRDIRWSPFYDDVFALVTTSGSLIVYNQYIAARSMVKITAHSGDVSTLDWHPTRPHWIATGGASDRSVKIWDLTDDLSVLGPCSVRSNDNVERNANTNTSKAESAGTNESSGTINDNGASVTLGATSSLTPLSYATRTLSSMSSAGFTHSSRHRGAAKRMLHVLAISASVTRVRWRPPAHENLILDDDDRHDAMMAVATAPIKGASAGGSGVLALWSYYRPFMPLSVVEGHQDGAVTDFDWLDTPQPLQKLTQRQKQKPTNKTWELQGRTSRKGRALSLSEEGATSRLPGATSHEVDSILYDNSERDDEFDKPIGIWQHVLSVGRDGRCLVQSLTRGDRPINKVPPSCFAMANLSPFQKGSGSLQLFSVCQDIPSGTESDFLLTGLRRDSTTANAPGMFREAPSESGTGQIVTFPIGWRAGKRLPETAPRIVFNVVDQGDLDESLNPVDDEKRQSVVVAPEVVHLSRFASRYRLYLDDDFPFRVDLCLHNAEVADSLAQPSLTHMWRMVAFLLDGTRIDGLPDNETLEPQNMMQFVVPSTIKALLEERANAGDVQTCVALCEVLEVVKPDQTVRIPELEVGLVREWYLSYIDLLRDMCLFSHATFLIRSCKDPYIGALHQQSTTIHESCPSCGKALLPEDGPARDKESSFARRSCKSCRRRVGLCFLCHEPVRGVYVWCPGCGHGGHLEHALQWFGGMGGNAVQEMCPTGCGHRCNSLRELSAFPKTESFHESQFDTGRDGW